MIAFIVTWFVLSLVLGILAGHCIHAMSDDKKQDPARSSVPALKVGDLRDEAAG